MNRFYIIITMCWSNQERKDYTYIKETVQRKQRLGLLYWLVHYYSYTTKISWLLGKERSFRDLQSLRDSPSGLWPSVLQFRCKHLHTTVPSLWSVTLTRSTSKACPIRSFTLLHKQAYSVESSVQLQVASLFKYSSSSNNSRMSKAHNRSNRLHLVILYSSCTFSALHLTNQRKHLPVEMQGARNRPLFLCNKFLRWLYLGVYFRVKTTHFPLFRTGWKTLEHEVFTLEH